MERWLVICLLLLPGCVINEVNKNVYVDTLGNVSIVYKTESAVDAKQDTELKDLLDLEVPFLK